MCTKNHILLFSVFLIVIMGALFLHCSYFGKKESADEKLVTTVLASNDGYVGSRSCRECHERFYNLWSPSNHGKAMQPIEDVIRNEALQLPDSSLRVGGRWFDVLLDAGKLVMIEKESKDAEEEIHRYPARWALGGRNIYYFLTPFSGGRLQTMPLAYDINRKEWYSNPASAVRHFVDANASDEEIDWKHSLYTFNTTCHSCHVSQLQKNYDVGSNTYHTTWKEPGINCETCHGPSEEHIRVCREAEKRGEVPEDLKIISVKSYAPQQHNSACASCHAKGTPLTKAYVPGEPFFQHFDLLTLENPDYYPDGRDLGENYTMTSWFQSKCISNRELSCITCHTSSGRYRYKNKDNEICISCHKEKAEEFEAHSRHSVDDSVTCVSCHMPETEFARMTRSDHSMRPPTPATTIEFGSPNACNNCHVDKSAEWANKTVKEWHGNYQDKTIEIARLIYEGRNGDFTHANEMLAMINDPNLNVIMRNSMIRILANYQGRGNEQIFYKALKDHSPLIRSSAADALAGYADNETKKALLRTLSDSVLLVRIRAIDALSAFPRQLFTQVEWQQLQNGFKEYEDFIMAYPDTWSAHYNMGNYYQKRNMNQEAVKSYEKAIELEDEAIMPMVNASIAYNILGNYSMAERNLLRALDVDPGNASIHLNYGLLLAESQRFEEAKKHLELALEHDSTLSQAAYNLAVISAQSDIQEALDYSAMAYRMEPENPKYGYAYAHYALQGGDTQAAVATLKNVIRVEPNYVDAYLMLANIYERTDNPQGAIDIYSKVLKLENLPQEYAQGIQMKINQLKK